MTQTALTREQVLAMEPMELSLAVAEHIFKAHVIGKQDCPEAKLLIGHFDKRSWQPLSGEPWQNAAWMNSEEKAWLRCPRYGEDISAAWEVLNNMKKYTFDLFWSDGRDENEQWVCIFSAGMKNYKAGMKHCKVYAGSAPEAITKAALLAVLDL